MMECFFKKKKKIYTSKRSGFLMKLDDFSPTNIVSVAAEFECNDNRCI